MVNWEQAQIKERQMHTLDKSKGMSHYAKSYKQYFSYLGIDSNLKGKSVVEVGPADIPALAFCSHLGNSCVIEPMPSEILKTFPIKIYKIPAENFDFSMFDEVWFFNVLQHVKDPYTIVKNAKKAKCVRWFEPIDQGTDECHLHNLTHSMFVDWFGDAKIYAGNEKADCFHTAKCSYGVWLRSEV